MSETEGRAPSVACRGEAGFESAIHHGSSETWYRRAGSGRPAILLARRDASDRDELFHRLAADWLVVEPWTVPERAVWPEWVAVVVDGLGLTRPVLAVDPPDLDAAEGCARVDPERVGGVMLLDGIDR